MKRKICNLILLLFCLIPIHLFAQGVMVVGVVKEKVTNDPLPGVTVKIKNTTNATVSDSDGKYSIKTNIGDVLVFTQVGMKIIEMSVANNQPIDVLMEEDNVLLDNVVVIGYGTVKESHLSGAVGSISAKDLQANVATSAAGALQGRMAGVIVQNASGGTPEGGMSINVRGESSLGNNNPLYVIDGMVDVNINLVNPNDIESIEVLKDAASAAIYGSRAAQGVVIITTKGGRKQTPTKVDLDIYTGIQKISKKIPVLNGNEYSRFIRYYNKGDNDNRGDEFFGEGTDWQDAVFRTAAIYRANVNISGGSNTATYNASAGYTNREGILITSEAETYTAKLKSDFFLLNDRLKIGQSVLMKAVKSHGSSSADMIFEILQMPPTVPLFDETRSGGYGASNTVNIKNPYGARMVEDNENRSFEMLFNAYGQLKIIKKLNYKINLGITKQNNVNLGRSNPADFGAAGNFEDTSKSDNRNTRDKYIVDNILTYDIDWNKHTVNLLAGYSIESNKNWTSSIHQQKGNPLTSNIDAPTTATTSWGKGATESMFGRILYAYDDKYLFSASIRRDGHDRLLSKYRYGNFPSVSVGWNIHNENFASSLKPTFDQIKFRASYGKLGDAGGVGYARGTVYSYLNYVQGNSIWNGATINAKWRSPENITWQNTETANIGLDMSLWKGKLTIKTDAYVRNTNDVLMEVRMPLSSGMSGRPVLNAGVVRNKGFEFTASYKNTVNNIYHYISANFATLSNKVTTNSVNTRAEITGNTVHEEAPAGINRMTVGFPLSYFYLIKTDGIFRSQEELDAHRSADGNLIQPEAQIGDLRLVDYNKDGIINEKDHQMAGSPFADLTFGIRFGAEWKGIDFNVLLDGSLGNEIYNFPRYRIESGKFQGNHGIAIADAWRPDHTNTDVPRLDVINGNNPNSWAYTDRWLEDGSFIRLKTVDVGYTLPKPIVSKVKLERVRVYLSAENLVTLTKYKGYTPDLGVTSSNIFTKGVDQGRYPMPRILSVGLQVNL